MFQDMFKVYDRVNPFMLNLAIARLKFPYPLRVFILNLFCNRKNQVITQHGLTDSYDVLIGIDQGEVISPLLWCIYYDPLLCEVHLRSHIGYTIQHSWFTNLDNPTSYNSLCERISSQAYMNDTNWMASSKEQLEETLGLTREFNDLNNILVNDDKAELMTSEVVEITNPNNKDKIIALPITLNVSDSHNIIITPLKKSQSAKFLEVQISLHCNKPYVKSQVALTIKRQCNIMRRKHLTDKLLEYIHVSRMSCSLCSSLNFI